MGQQTPLAHLAMTLNLAVSGMFVAMVIIIIAAAILTAGDDEDNGDGYGP